MIVTGTASVAGEHLTATAELVTRKATCRGLADRTGPPRLPGVRSCVLQVPLRDILSDTGRVNLDPIRRLLDDTSRTDTTGGVCLRIGAGPESPPAMLERGITLPPVGAYGTITVPRIWEDWYQDSVRLVHAALASAFDGDERVREVTGWWQGFEFSEEWTIRRAADPTTRALLLDAGYDTSRDQAQVLGMVAEHHAVWTRTPLQLFVSVPYQRVERTATGTRVTKDLAFTRAVLEAARAQSPDTVIGINNAAPTSWDTDPLYEFVAGFGGPRRDQTLAWSRLGATDVDRAAGMRDTILAARGHVDVLELPYAYARWPDMVPEWSP